MKCPVDGAELESRSADMNEIQECLQCRGLWFSKENFSKAKDRAQPDLSWMDFDLWSDKEALEVEASNRNCPVCKQLLASVHYPRTRTRIDYCAKEHGVWLDKGEFETIIAALENELNSMHVPEYIRASVGEARELLTGKEGFISEWRDLNTVMRLLQYRILADNPKFAKALTDFQSAFHF
ncbi:MAG: zf-TFIIB domain-containing protein [Anaerolineales bacterium]|nr:zf-TFIIB domain-containing protein [Anaerolineales bacterium]